VREGIYLEGKGILPPERCDDAADAPFWDAIDRGELVLARCTACGEYYARCQACTVCGAGARDSEWVPASGRGTIRTFAVFHRAYHPFFAALVPYNVAVVALEEGPELLTNVVGCRNEELAVGMRVRIVIRDRGGMKIHQAQIAG
jgi:uncharacterized OB-fold protein